jgi:hypothetical protein
LRRFGSDRWQSGIFSIIKQVGHRNTFIVVWGTRLGSPHTIEEVSMATAKQTAAAKRNVRKAQSASRQQRTIAHMPKATRSALGKQAAAVAQRKRTGGSSPLTRAELYEEAKRRDLPGRSKMGRAELARALGHK